MKWKLIETLTNKEDCGEILVFNDRGQHVVHFDKDWCDTGWWMVNDGKNYEYPLRGSEPTHWMPLPKNPQ